MTAYYTKNENGDYAKNFAPTMICRLKIETGGSYVIFGCVTMSNYDSDSQICSAQLTARDGSIILAETGLYTTGYTDIRIALQAAYTWDQEIVDLRCSTYNGYGFNGSLIAIWVDGIKSAGV